MQPQTKQQIRFVSKCLLLLLAVLIVAGVTYEQIGERLDRKRFPQVGRSVDIGGRSLNIYCSGEGGPVVILDTGGSAPGYENLLFQRKVAEFTRACWFDRAGLGWSDPSPVEQTSAAIAEDLHALLHAAYRQLSHGLALSGRAHSISAVEDEVLPVQARVARRMNVTT